ncbi:glycoside hydrolase family 75 protein [Dactylosporangium fulvum]|uniref:Ricin-type beta-trefoil lectin domain protein n=1 Tax=Dactylosporangium fulvum TaxID=53359 RepID=A0ABY5VNU8_9ACTN|nr:ricin-type beta-trefoil lectin domain protein [Dactylosporangium fulvum]UWP79402.1 ricin-type beta-trefoil lectin domain protein [Dactylosporangium fulvum]
MKRYLTAFAAVALTTAATAFALVSGTTVALAAAPTAAQLLAKTQTCNQVSNGKYATDDGGAATVAVCKSGSAFFWTADMDIDCDGIGTTHCNAGTDPWYQPQTSFTTSTGAYFTSEVTRYYVVPLPSTRFNYQSQGIRPGAVAAVVYNNRVAYAVFADEGPDNIIGEGSYALAVALGIDPNPATGGTAGPVTFIVFPSTVPSPVESNSAIDTTGVNAANAWLGSGPTTGPTTGAPAGQITGAGGKCVDVAGANSANGTAVQLYDCNGSTAQRWTRAADGTLRALGKCMDVTGAGTANGTKVQLYDCNGTAAQQWTRSGQTLINAGSGKCLDATGSSSANGTRLQIWSCSGGANQNWTVP